VLFIFSVYEVKRGTGVLSRDIPGEIGKMGSPLLDFKRFFQTRCDHGKLDYLQLNLILIREISFVQFNIVIL